MGSGYIKSKRVKVTGFINEVQTITNAALLFCGLENQLIFQEPHSSDIIFAILYIHLKMSVIALMKSCFLAQGRNRVFLSNRFPIIGSTPLVMERYI